MRGDHLWSKINKVKKQNGKKNLLIYVNKESQNKIKN